MFRPPCKIYQCPEGDIFCEKCRTLPVCPKCREPLDGVLSR